jgi:molybdate transport system permease protein
VTHPVEQQYRRPPAVLLLPAVIGLLFLVLPFIGLLVRAPWSKLRPQLTAPDTIKALELSFVTSIVSTGICLLIGVPMAFILARTVFPGQRLLRALVLLPLVLPPVVGGVALFTAFGRTGIVGMWLDRWFGIDFPFTRLGVIMAQTFVSLPFLVIAVEGALRGADPRYEEAASTLGASRWTAFRRITLPLVGPGIAAGSVLCWARALGEFGATITFAGNLPGSTQTMPLYIYNTLENDPYAAILLSLVLVALCVVVLVGLRGRWIGTPA